MYAKNVRRWMVPFLQRCDKQQSGSFYSLLHDYLLDMATDDLTRCLLIFEISKADVSPHVCMQTTLFAMPKHKLSRDDTSNVITNKMF